ncbi:hypothetical protein [Burkholderia stagnalis]|nr:hypothetical protein [Burkholderia stagnalis]
MQSIVLAPRRAALIAINGTPAPRPETDAIRRLFVVRRMATRRTGD